MLTRRLSFILPLALLPALVACTKHEAPPPPLDPAADAAVIAKPGVPHDALARAIDGLFQDKGAGETRALLVLSGGRIVAERYGAGYDQHTRLIGWSMTKSITGALIGLLVADGRLALDQSAPVPAWQRPGDPRGAITLRELLQMRAGLRHNEASDPVYESGEVRMLFLDGRDNMAAWAEEQPLAAEPGTTWRYSSATAVILADIAARALTDSPDPGVRRKVVNDYLRARLFEPTGMTGMVAEFDAAGTFIGSSMAYGTARDWGRFGELLRNGGTVNGTPVLPRGWVDFMTSPSPTNPGYGGQVWLNRPQADGDVMLMPGKAPASLFASIGHLGQYVLVSPTQTLTVVRLGKSDSKQRQKVLDHLTEIVSLYPASANQN